MPCGCHTAGMRFPRRLKDCEAGDCRLFECRPEQSGKADGRYRGRPLNRGRGGKEARGGETDDLSWGMRSGVRCNVLKAVTGKVWEA